MDWVGKAAAIAKKYRYVLLVLLLGLVFMLIPGREEEQQPQEAYVQEQQTQPDFQESLALILSKIEGAGKVEVLLTQAAGEKIIYQTDEDGSSALDSSDSRSQTVIITNSERGEEAVVRQVIPPAYLGAVIVCQGGDNPAVKLAIVEAVADVTGLTADKITVLKMK